MASAGQGQNDKHHIIEFSSRGLNVSVRNIARDHQRAMIALSSINKAVVFRSTYRGG
ncbi:hypothetical protein ACNKHL_21285 [Shigella flexneri]